MQELKTSVTLKPLMFPLALLFKVTGANKSMKEYSVFSKP